MNLGIKILSFILSPPLTSMIAILRQSLSVSIYLTMNMAPGQLQAKVIFTDKDHVRKRKVLPGFLPESITAHQKGFWLAYLDHMFSLELITESSHSPLWVRSTTPGRKEGSSRISALPKIAEGRHTRQINTYGYPQHLEGLNFLYFCVGTMK